MTVITTFFISILKDIKMPLFIINQSALADLINTKGGRLNCRPL